MELVQMLLSQPLRRISISLSYHLAPSPNHECSGRPL
uniref:Uncharacterized protein n=1 Tax=Setaria italica TaxID=4555 RepID=K3Z1V4_SETIT